MENASRRIVDDRAGRALIDLNSLSDPSCRERSGIVQRNAIVCNHDDRCAINGAGHARSGRDCFAIYDRSYCCIVTIIDDLLSVGVARNKDR